MKKQPNFEDIPVVDCYKYLGILINRRLTFAEHFEAISKKASKLCNCLAKIPQNQLSTKNQIILWKQLIFSTISYGILSINYTSPSIASK